MLGYGKRSINRWMGEWMDVSQREISNSLGSKVGMGKLLVKVTWIEFEETQDKW